MRLMLLLILPLMSSCDYFRATSGPCREDKFFCHEPFEQKALLKTISDPRLLRVTRINYEKFRPPSQDFAREIARRGPAGIDILRKLRVEDDIDVKIFRDTVRAYLANYDIDVCQSNGAMANTCKSMASRYN